jgi:hypothetical protein
MTDHIARMVNGWFERARSAPSEREAAAHLIDAIHRLIREAEHETSRRCAELASAAAPPERRTEIAMAIRSVAGKQTLPRRALQE